MDELFLHYVWQFQRFDATALLLTSGLDLQVFHPGVKNRNAGPDFHEARLKIDGLTWVGTVEIHHRSSDWVAHGHTTDPAYQHIILHVVWDDDRPLYYPDGKAVPTLELKNRVDPHLMVSYRHLINDPQEIMCASQLHRVASIVRSQVLEGKLVERLQLKAEECLAINRKFAGDWETTVYYLLASCFGMNVNKEPFRRLVEQLPFWIIQKNHNNPLALHALVFGQAGMLAGKPVDEYQTKLTSEYQYLCHKFGLETTLDRSQWKYGKLRPPNFPTVRLSQFASLLAGKSNLFQPIIDTERQPTWRDVFFGKVGEYWKAHYDFGKEWKSEHPAVGQVFMDHVLINAVVPLLAGASAYFDRQDLMDRAVDWLEKLPPENNAIVRKYVKHGFDVTTAAESQGCLHLFHHNCQKKRCLQCNIGVSILKPVMH
ncbi:MAG: DUF2851 family protein [Cyclobacteriaceae bacterium]|nr:DUF2851 family protein [Cyclobacteriaceae bacterium]